MIPTFNDLQYEGLSKTMWEKEKNAGNLHFLLFPQCFLPSHKNLNVKSAFILSSANALILDQSRILFLVKS